MSQLKKYFLNILYESNDKSLKNLVKFLENKHVRNAHVTVPKFDHFYVRKTQRHINQKMCYMFDLATIEVKEKYKRTGVMTNLFNNLCLMLPKYNFDGIFIENLLTEEIISWAEKNNFQKLEGVDNFTPCYYFLF